MLLSLILMVVNHVTCSFSHPASFTHFIIVLTMVKSRLPVHIGC